MNLVLLQIFQGQRSMKSIKYRVSYLLKEVDSIYIGK
jgi:hypothetical protein